MQDKHEFMTTLTVTKYSNSALTELSRKLIVSRIDIVTHSFTAKAQQSKGH
jgi:hypothetical protein